MLSPILGHASGFSWDEALLVMAPIAVVAGVLFLANQRAKRLGDATATPPTTDASAEESPRSSGDASVATSEAEDPPVSRP